MCVPIPNRINWKSNVKLSNPTSCCKIEMDTQNKVVKQALSSIYESLVCLELILFLFHVRTIVFHYISLNSIDLIVIWSQKTQWIGNKKFYWNFEIILFRNWFDADFLHPKKKKKNVAALHFEYNLIGCSKDESLIIGECRKCTY